MIKNYFQVAFRNLIRNKSYVLINTFGLGISLACCITAYLLLAYNIEFDSFHDNDKVSNIFKVHAHFKEKDGRNTQGITSPLPLAAAAASDIAGIERYTRFITGGGYMRYGEQAHTQWFGFADSTFFDMFELPLIKGSHQAFKNKHSIFIDQELSIKFFGKEDPIGKVMVLNFTNDKQLEVIVGGVLDKIPLNNTFAFKALLRFENFYDINNIEHSTWGDWRDPSTFMQLTTPGNAAHISKQLAKYVPTRNEAKKDMVVTHYQLEPFKANFTQDQINSSYVNLRMSFVPLLVFVSMAVMILLIACFNLTNTSIALTSKRLKEVGVRKTVGAARSQIMSQFLLETVITISLSLIVGLLFAQIIVPAFTSMWNLPYGMEDLSGLNLFVALMVMIFIASLLAGMYPAIFNSKFKPVALLKGNVRINGTNGLTRTLVAAQFALSVIVLIAGVMFIQNTNFQQEIKFGYDKEMLITVDLQSEKEFEAMRNVALSNPKIISIAVCDQHIGYSNYGSPVQVDTGTYDVRHLAVGKNYFETLGLEFVDGKPFDVENASDMQEGLVVNEAFLKKVGIAQANALDKVVFVHGNKKRIMGVVQNHIDNLFRSKEPEPFLFYAVAPASYHLMLVKVNPEDLGETQKFLEKNWKELFPTKVFQSQFQEDIVLKETKQTNANLEKIFLFLTVLGGSLSASGIFSLASLNIARRTKEIGIRKALGASVSNVVTLLNKEFVIILTIASILGSVAGYYLTNALLDEIYAYHITIGIIPLVLCGLLIFIIGILTTSSTIFRAAKLNPVDTLRNE